MKHTHLFCLGDFFYVQNQQNIERYLVYETGIGKHAVLEVFDHLVGCPKHPGWTSLRQVGMAAVRSMAISRNVSMEHGQQLNLSFSTVCPSSSVQSRGSLFFALAAQPLTTHTNIPSRSAPAIPSSARKRPKSAPPPPIFPTCKPCQRTIPCKRCSAV